MSDHQERLKSESEEHSQVKLGPVTCLGMTFENDDARRTHFTGELCKKLQKPELLKYQPHDGFLYGRFSGRFDRMRLRFLPYPRLRPLDFST